MLADLHQRRADLAAICRRFAVRRLEAFGSAVSGNFDARASDLDFLVEFDSPNQPGYADRYFGLLEALETLFGRRVDLVVASAVKNPYLREAIQRSRSLLYAA